MSEQWLTGYNYNHVPHSFNTFLKNNVQRVRMANTITTNSKTTRKSCLFRSTTTFQGEFHTIIFNKLLYLNFLYALGTAKLE